ncbi:hypothetical protein BZA77DRAFT_360640 [Pyronema omphalodes]|nr:hypothetical protein BZA77DRAFT_360640 [Pyronema omphalodes]
MTQEDAVDHPSPMEHSAQNPITEVSPTFLPAEGDVVSVITRHNIRYHGTVHDAVTVEGTSLIRNERQPVPDIEKILLELKNAVSYGTEHRDWRELKQPVLATPENVYLRLMLKWEHIIEITYEKYSWADGTTSGNLRSRTSSASDLSAIQKDKSMDDRHNTLGEVRAVPCKTCKDGIAWDHPSNKPPWSTGICGNCRYDQAVNDLPSCYANLSPDAEPIKQKEAEETPSSTEDMKQQIVEETRPSSITPPPVTETTGQQKMVEESGSSSNNAPPEAAVMKQQAADDSDSSSATLRRKSESSSKTSPPKKKNKKKGKKRSW